jgi:hypothetical protein
MKRMQGCTDYRCQVTQVTKFYAVVPNSIGSSVWNVLYITYLASRILRSFEILCTREITTVKNRLKLLGVNVSDNGMLPQA